MVYRWHPDENFWPERVAIDVAPFDGIGGQDVFLRKHELLTSLGVRVPRILAQDDSLALVEDLTGGKLESCLNATSVGALRDMLLRMHTHQVPAEIDAPAAAFERGRRALAESVARVPRLAAVEDRLAYALSSGFSVIEPRSTHAIIHGELGPDHVMLTASGEPALIDIEGTMAFDVEWEHAFLELRFGSWYPHLHTVELDSSRMELYRLVMYLSLVAGPLQLLDGDFPRPEGMRQIAEWNVERTLASLLSLHS